MSKWPIGSRLLPRRFAGTTVLVTGASSGVGRAVALELARRGARVLATARRGDRLVAVAAEAAGFAAHPLLVEAGDITAADFRHRLVGVAASAWGRIDILVAAAGSGAAGLFADSSPATLTRILDVDFVAPAELVRAAMPLLRASADPGVVLVGSILGLHPLPEHAEYCAAKAALRSLAGSLRVELAGDGIQVLLASLGPTESEFWDSLLAGRRPTWSRGWPMPVARAARLVVRALAHRRREVLPGWQAKGYALAARLFPRIIDRAMMRKLRRLQPSSSASR
jgi:short-subunit dehydrogenase